MARAQQLPVRSDAIADDGVGARSAAWRRLDPRASAVVVAILALAATLRFWGIDAAAQNPFYDAAVRSMGLSWHNFFFGAFDPGGILAIDKPPVDLWLQVAATKALGFNRTALSLPEALGGTVAVALVYAAVTRASGRLAGAFAALALAVLPIAVLTSRSDTMDSVMSAMLAAALWAAIVAVQSRRARYVLLSAAFVGIAFDVKLAQALIPLPALALLWWAAATRRRRLAVTSAAAAVCVVFAMAWAFTASLTPLGERPFPIGSRTGSIYRAIFVFNGIERLTASGRTLAPVASPSAPGAIRLLRSLRPGYASLIGLELAATLGLALAAAMLWIRERHARHDPSVSERGDPDGPPGALGVPEPGGAGRRSATWVAGALAVWVATCYVLFSFIGHLQPRYLEAMSPGLTAMLGICAAYLAYRAQRPRAAWLCAGALLANATFALLSVGVADWGVQVCLIATAVTVVCLCVAPLRERLLGGLRSAGLGPRLALVSVAALALLAAPADASIDIVEQHASDASPSGSGSQYSNYLRSHGDNARYEVAAASVLDVAGLIVRDARPVLVLRDVDGKLVSLARLQRLVHEGAVRYAILPHACASGRHCASITSWSVRHSVKVMPGLFHYRLSGRAG